MLFNSLSFLIFLPIVILIYFIIPNKIKYLWLLASSYYFYMCWNAKYAVLIMFSTVITYLSGILIEKYKTNRKNNQNVLLNKKFIVFFCVFLNLAVLFYFKYCNFTIDLLTTAFQQINIELNVSSIDILLPVGISFYTFQALGYTIDVYRGTIHAEKNLFRYALFVSFFPQLVAGPIERSKNLLKQLAVPKKFDFQSAKTGLFLMLWGFFLKIVVADRIATLVDTIYGDYTVYTGFYLIIATILFAIQIYCDFYGYSTIAVGSAKMLGIDLMENFDAPYLSTSVSTFWRKWHISLTSWFKDYLYIPLGGSRKGKLRKYLNKMVVFLVSGLWHGASITFVVWGGLNGIFQVIGECLQPARDKMQSILHINKNWGIYKLLQMAITFVLINFTWIFFRAESFTQAISIIGSIFGADNSYILSDGSLFTCGLDKYNFILMIACIVILLIADIVKHKGISIHQNILKQNFVVQCLVIALSLGFILLFGIYGTSLDQSSFIYFQF